MLKFQISVIGAKTLSTLTITTMTFGILGLVVMLSIMIFIRNMLNIKTFGMMINRMSH